MDPSMLVLRSKSGQISSEQASIIICFIEDPDQPTLLIFPVKTFVLEKPEIIFRTFCVVGLLLNLLHSAHYGILLQRHICMMDLI